MWPHLSGAVSESQLYTLEMLAGPDWGEARVPRGGAGQPRPLRSGDQGKLRIRIRDPVFFDPGIWNGKKSRAQDPWSGINIPNTQHWCKLMWRDWYGYIVCAVLTYFGLLHMIAFLFPLPTVHLLKRRGDGVALQHTVRSHFWLYKFWNLPCIGIVPKNLKNLKICITVQVSYLP